MSFGDSNLAFSISPNLCGLLTVKISDAKWFTASINLCSTVALCTLCHVCMCERVTCSAVILILRSKVITKLTEMNVFVVVGMGGRVEQFCALIELECN